MTDNTVWLIESGELSETPDMEKVVVSRVSAETVKAGWEDMMDSDERYVSMTEMELSPKVDE